jgi:hypothetical protein
MKAANRSARALSSSSRLREVLCISRSRLTDTLTKECELSGNNHGARHVKLGDLPSPSPLGPRRFSGNVIRLLATSSTI